MVESLIFPEIIDRKVRKIKLPTNREVDIGQTLRNEYRVRAVERSRTHTCVIALFQGR